MSDTCVGGILGCVTGYWFLGDTRLSRRFSRWEAGWALRQQTGQADQEVVAMPTPWQQLPKAG